MMNKQHTPYQVIPYPKIRRVLGAMYPWLARSRCDQGACVLARVPSQDRRSVVVHSVHHHVFGTSGR